ncbi:NUDIX hydrolase [Gordonia soli]|uniref:Nudix hydrolase domain-containing protein n=1 Tax=Gordonia soli NBRC 108243 TaxID=1223545 RepID=M0QQD5_9ACTN|nr:NUDIX domain-containing protein [Gordonia soli]GAC70870.1 hypothetical protein GS4_42_00480 [Gordonia soli NBRC 108243]
MTEPDDIRVSAVVLRDADGRVLTVRKRGTRAFMFPGGKPEVGETAADTAVREVAEELGIGLDTAALVPMGTFRTAAANEEGRMVEAIVYEYGEVWSTQVTPAAEIEEVRWRSPDDLTPELAPLLAEAVFPALAGRAGGAGRHPHRR